MHGVSSLTRISENSFCNEGVGSNTKDRTKHPNVSNVEVVDLHKTEHKHVAQCDKNPHLPSELVLNEPSIEFEHCQTDSRKNHDLTNE